MWQYLLHLSAQQTTAPELATFLVLVTLGSIVVAALLYGAIMTVAWAITLRKTCRWRDAVFPSLPRLRQFKWEYALAALTSVVLTLTLAEKDALVDQVLALPAEGFLDDRLTAGLFPLHRLPDATDLGGPSLTQEIHRQANLTLGDLVRGPLEAGRSGEVRALFGAAVRQVLATHPSLHARLARWLTLACVLLILGYVVWLSRQRAYDLSHTRDAGDVESAYGNVFGRLTVLGVCLALLLATPAVAQDPDLLADSALGAARREAPASTPEVRKIDSLVGVGIDRQYALQAVGAGTDTLLRRYAASISARLDALPDWNPRLSTHERDLTALRDSLRLLGNDLNDIANRLRDVRAGVDSVGRRVAGLPPDPSSRLSAHEADLKTLAGRLDGLDRQMPNLRDMLDSLRNRGLLLVETEAGRAYSVTVPRTTAVALSGVAPQVVGTGTTIGLHWLQPGRYTVTETGTPASETVTIAAGQAITVHVMQRIP